MEQGGAVSESDPSATPLDQALFRDVIGRFATGVTVITTTADDRDFGTTASAISSLSLEPPMLLVCLNKTSETREAITRSQRFAVNILSEGQADVAFAFAKKSPDKFAQAQPDRRPNGMPLIPGSLAQLECVVTETAVGGTHTVFLGEVVHATGTDDAPLTYYRGRFGRFEDMVGDIAYRELRGLRLGSRDVAAAREAIDARCAIEIAVVDKVSGHLTDADFETLTALATVTATAAAASPPDIPALIRADEEFHARFVGLLGNEALEGFLSRLDLRRLWSRAVPDLPHFGRMNATFLSELIEACRAGDGDRARRILYDHADAVKQAATDAIG